MKVKGTLLIMDGEADTSGDRIDPSGVDIRQKITVTRNFDLSFGSILGIGDVKQEGDRLNLVFDLPTSKLPDFPLWPAVAGKIMESEKLPDGTRLIKRCKIDMVGISTTPNQDPRIPPLEECGDDGTDHNSQQHQPRESGLEVRQESPSDGGSPDAGDMRP